MAAEVSAPLAGQRVLALSPVNAYGGFNTSAHRIRALAELGARLRVIDSSSDSRRGSAALSARIANRLFSYGLPVPLPDSGGDGERLIAAASEGGWDMIWLDKALTAGRRTLERVRAACPEAVIVGFSPDDMYGRHNQSRQFLEALPVYDVFITTKSFNVKELGALGCPRVVFVGNGFDPEAFHPIAASEDERRLLGGDVGFIGTFEAERAGLVCALADHGLRVRVWGSGWERLRSRPALLQVEERPLYGDAFAKACGAFKINLCFLRKQNRDVQTTRSVEIPACGGFMLAERSDEHLAMFEEHCEAAFFGSRAELIAKCEQYLADESARRRIAEAGHARCWRSYSNTERLRPILTDLLGPHQTRGN